MVDLILLICCVLLLIKPELCVTKKLREKANEEELKRIKSNYRKMALPLGMFVLFNELNNIVENDTIEIIVGIGFIIVCLMYIPIIKESIKIQKDITQNDDSNTNSN